MCLLYLDCSWRFCRYRGVGYVKKRRCACICICSIYEGKLSALWCLNDLFQPYYSVFGAETLCGPWLFLLLNLLKSPESLDLWFLRYDMAKIGVLADMTAVFEHGVSDGIRARSVWCQGMFVGIFACVQNKRLHRPPPHAARQWHRVARTTWIKFLGKRSLGRKILNDSCLC